MSFASILAVSLLAAAPALAADRTSVPPAAFTNTPLANAEAVAAVAASATRSKVPQSGRAPDFQYQSYDALWQHLHNVLEHGDVLLVFGASDVDLRTLERERESLTKGGVLPFAVIEKNDRDVWASVRRLGLTFSLLADPRGAIGSQYGVFDASLGHSRPAWFVIDKKGRIRDAGTSMPAQAWPSVALTALGRSQGGGTQAASSR